jgi:hypothetical protein
MGVPDQVLAGARLFDAGDYFEAHEAWEGHWGAGAPEERALTLALIKAAVALHHLRAGNVAGFSWQAECSVPGLRAHARVWPELACEDLADELESLASQARFHGGPVEGWDAPRLLRRRTSQEG